MSGRRLVVYALGAGIFAILGPSTARAEPPKADPKAPSKSAPKDDKAAEKPAPKDAPKDAPKEAPTFSDKVGEKAKAAAETVWWPIGQGAQLLYNATENAAGLLEREQVVPRMKKLLSPRWGSIGVYPTFTIQTTRQYRAVPGLRMVAQAGAVATTLFGQYGGNEAYEVESRVRISLPGFDVPVVLSLEAYRERYLYWFSGLGQSPFTDSRNEFVSTPRKVYYREHKERALASLGFRPTADGDLELFVSTSVQQRTIEDPDDPGTGTLRDVFAPRSREGSYRTTRLAYTELAVRLDTREARGGPMPGWLAEVYGGLGYGLREERTELARLGWMTAYFLDVGKQHVVSPRFTFDAVQPLEASVIPFEELPVQPAFRAPGDRRDYFSAVFSLDVRRRITEGIAARVFSDFGRVAPSLIELRPAGTRVGGGFAIDFFSKGAEVGRAGLAFSKEGVSLFLTIGSRSPFSDRQHRDLHRVLRAGRALPDDEVDAVVFGVAAVGEPRDGRADVGRRGRALRRRAGAPTDDVHVLRAVRQRDAATLRAERHPELAVRRAGELRAADDEVSTLLDRVAARPRPDRHPRAGGRRVEELVAGEGNVRAGGVEDLDVLVVGIGVGLVGDLVDHEVVGRLPARRAGVAGGRPRRARARCSGRAAAGGARPGGARRACLPRRGSRGARGAPRGAGPATGPRGVVARLRLRVRAAGREGQEKGGEEKELPRHGRAPLPLGGPKGKPEARPDLRPRTNPGTPRRTA